MTKYFYILLLTSFTVYSENDPKLDQKRDELLLIQEQINKQAMNFQSTNKQYDELIAKLQSDEEAIGLSAIKLKKIDLSLTKRSDILDKLKSKISTLEKLKNIQQNSLANQLSSIYTNGKYDYAKMLLSQQDPATIERLLSYYQFLNTARINSITQVKITMDEQTNLIKKQNEQYEILIKLRDEQKKQTESLKLEQKERLETLKSLKESIDQTGQKIEQLQTEESTVKKIITNALVNVDIASQSKTESPLVGLTNFKGKLTWPAKGKIIASYGSLRGSGLRWKGIMLSADEGTNVNVIADGKVIFADWLKGSGLLLVVDHGLGYMSLYAHAQALLKNPGDYVKEGDTIALAGNSGGNSESGLYFELRYKGQHVDPTPYLTIK